MAGMYGCGQTYKVYYEWDSFNNKFRVWEDRNPGDTFDLVEKADLDRRIDEYKTKSIEVIEGLPVDYDEGD